MEKEEVMAQVEASYAAVLERIAGLSDVEMTRPRRDDGWSARDIVAHLASWYEVAAERLDLITEGRANQILWIDEDLDEWNARFHAETAGLSPAQVRERLTQAYAGLMSAVEALPEGAWDDTTLRVPVTVWLPVCTYEHDAEHLPEL